MGQEVYECRCNKCKRVMVLTKEQAMRSCTCGGKWEIVEDISAYCQNRLHGYCRWKGCQCKCHKDKQVMK